MKRKVRCPACGGTRKVMLRVWTGRSWSELKKIPCSECRGLFGSRGWIWEKGER